MGRHISDTRTMRRDIYSVHPPYGRTLAYLQICYARRQAVALLFAAAKILRTNIDR